MGMGALILLSAGPFVVWQVFACTVWEFADKKTINMIKVAGWFCNLFEPVSSKLSRHKEDGYVIVMMVWLGVCLPAWFFFELWHCCTFLREMGGGEMGGGGGVREEMGGKWEGGRWT
jgi:hypothetical protein